MKFYREITLHPNEEIPLYFLWEKVYQQLHLAFVEQMNNGKSKVGVAFPKYNMEGHSLCNQLRLFAADEQTLEQMQCDKWLNRLSDYVHVSQIKPVPEKLEGYACFKHIKPKGSKENLARRRARRKGETYEQALVHFKTYEADRSRLPYINMQSQTNGQRFRLFIEKAIVDQPQAGFYSCYGLSGNTTVPLF